MSTAEMVQVSLIVSAASIVVSLASLAGTWLQWRDRKRR